MGYAIDAFIFLFGSFAKETFIPAILGFLAFIALAALFAFVSGGNVWTATKFAAIAGVVIYLVVLLVVTLRGLTQLS